MTLRNTATVIRSQSNSTAVKISPAEAVDVVVLAVFTGIGMIFGALWRYFFGYLLFCAGALAYGYRAGSGTLAKEPEQAPASEVYAAGNAIAYREP